ncbi:MAG: carbohydrate-binding domain-containing protein [Lachnospiraceae bacterium]|nr:carbohydrate-binding domain-containing protein [Lachnospiraceae bacterium]
MRKKKILALFLMGTMMFGGCAAQVNQGTEANQSTQTNESVQENIQSSPSMDSGMIEIDTSDIFSGRDKEVGYDETDSVSIQLSDDGSACESDAVLIEGNTITITDEGTYILSGTLTDGMVAVAAEDTDKVQLVLNNVNISNSESAALYILSADKVFVTTAAGSENTMENGGSYTEIDENNIDAAVFSKSDLTFNGEGKLAVTAKAGHGIVSKDDLVFTCGTYEITSAAHGISGKDSVRIANGSYKIVSGKDGIHAENADDTDLGFVYAADGTFEIISGQDGISAGSWLQIEDGDYAVTTGEGSAAAKNQNMQERMPADREAEAAAAEEDSASIKGIKAGVQMVLKSGTYTLDTEDDALHSNGTITISGGAYILSSGDDGIHADASVLISGGSLDIAQSYEGIEGLGIDITGGEISILASDDGINAAGGNDSSGFEGPGPGGDQFAVTEGAYICISGGTLHINASGDGIDSNGDLTVSGGETYLAGPVNDGNGSLDYNGTAVITGGTFAASGSSGMAQNFGSSSAQGVMMVNLDNKQEAGTQILLTDSAGTILCSWTAQKEYSSVIVSCPEIKQGQTYTLTAGTAEEGITMNSLVYGNSSQMGGRPGGGGGMKDDGMKGSREMGDMPGGGDGVPDPDKRPEGMPQEQPPKEGEDL